MVRDDDPEREGRVKAIDMGEFLDGLDIFG